jgi:pimeloyl-ACP methyl ester carboxylesterase
VINSRGQSVSASDRLYLAKDVRVLLVWGDRDPIIPVSHGRRAHDEMPGSQLEIFEGVGHLPPVEAPERFVMVLERFLAETEPAQFDAQTWRARLRASAGEP